MSGVKIRSVLFRSFKCFDDLEIDCKKNKSTLYQWTVLLGNNNTGKTSILKAIADLRPERIHYVHENNKKHNDMITAFFFNAEGKKELNEDSLVSAKLTNIDPAPWSYGKKVWSMDSENLMSNFYLFGYGVSRYPSNTSLSDQECGDCETLFSHDKRLVNIEEWLMQMDYAAKNNNELAAKRLLKIKEIICGNIFPEISDFKFESTDSMHSFVLFQTKDGWFRYKQLGYGYQSMLSWVIDLCKRMYDKYPDSDNPLQESAVVLVDEIDLHLHPKWQRDIISIISNVFKNVQFIVTTHSPMVIQSMTEVNLYVLRRQGDKVVAERSPVTNFSGWTVDEILRDAMKMEDDIYSDLLQENYASFEKALDEDNKEKARKAYKKLLKMLHPQNPQIRLMKLQFDQMSDDD
jgi:predicted ATP-binding protein involved in virulence